MQPFGAPHSFGKGLAMHKFLCILFPWQLMKADKLKAKLLKGLTKNWSFEDACLLARHCGWGLTRSNGSHSIFTHENSAIASLNLQNKKGEAKPYQLTQMKDLIEEFNL